MQSQTAVFFLAGATLIGGAAIGKAAIDHATAPPAERAILPAKPKLGRDVVTWAATIAGIGYALWSAPKLLTEWYAYAEEYVEW